jgi:hypothetical protein
MDHNDKSVLHVESRFELKANVGEPRLLLAQDRDTLKTEEFTDSLKAADVGKAMALLGIVEIAGLWENDPVKPGDGRCCPQ